jgi:hypothetical protein
MLRVTINTKENWELCEKHKRGIQHCIGYLFRIGLYFDDICLGRDAQQSIILQILKVMKALMDDLVHFRYLKDLNSVYVTIHAKMYSL